MSLLETLRNDAAVLGRLLYGMPRANSHAERLQAFYAPQAERYDSFRERLLAGRRELMRKLAPAPGAYVVELGAGTGRNIEFFGDAINTLDRVDLVDLCPALLDRAARRTMGKPNVNVVHADATLYRPERPVDCVYFSYALTMIPDWRAALDNALAMLKPGGVLGVVDFQVPGDGQGARAAIISKWWRAWFAHDGVMLNPEHLAALQCALPRHYSIELTGPVPYLPGLRAPYYLFVGRKPGRVRAVHTLGKKRS